MNEPTAPDLTTLDDVYPAQYPPNHPKFKAKITTDKVTEIASNVVRSELDANKRLYPNIYDPMQTLIDQKIQANNNFFAIIVAALNHL